MAADTLICGPVYDPARDSRIPGSIVESCGECERQVWLAPSGQAILAERGLRLLCVPCGKSAILADPKPEIEPLSAEQMTEIRRALSDDA